MDEEELSYDEKEMINLADAGHVYDAEEMKIENHSNMRQKIREAIRSKGGPIMVDVVLDPMQPFSPRVTSERKSDGRMVSKPLEDMYPFLDREEFNKVMIIKPLDEIKIDNLH